LFLKFLLNILFLFTFVSPFSTFVSLYVKPAIIMRGCNIFFLCFGPFDVVDKGTVGVVVSAFEVVGLHLVVSSACKGKAVPLQACSGPEGSRKLRFPDFMTTAQDAGKVVSLTHRPPLPPGNTPGTHFC
jgi:hypothetical protein